MRCRILDIYFDDKNNIIKHCFKIAKVYISKNFYYENIEQYKENKLPYDTPNYRKSDDNIHWVVYNKSTNKILKSINYTPATNELKDFQNWLRINI